MPSASEAGVSGEYLDAVLTARPDLAEPLRAALESVEGLAPGVAIAQLRDTDPEGWGVLTAVVPGAYFLNPAIREPRSAIRASRRVRSIPTRRRTTWRTGCSIP